PARPTPPVTKSAKRTLQGIKPASIPRPLVPGPPRPPPRKPSLPLGTQKPPAVNPAGPSIREPFLPAMSPKAPPAKVDANDDASEEPTLREIVTEPNDPGRVSELGLADRL